MAAHAVAATSPGLRVTRGQLVVAVRSLAFRRGRTLLSILGVALGVGLLFGSVVTSAAIDRSVARTVAAQLGRADLRIAALGEGGLGPTSLRELIETPGIELVSPELERRTFLERTPGSPADPAAFAAPVTILGVDPDPWRVIHAPTLVEGSWLAADGSPAAVLAAPLARSLEVGIGDEIAVLGGPNGPTRLAVVGIVAGATPLAGGDDRLVIVPLVRAAGAFGTDRVSRADALLVPGTATDEALGSLERALRAEPYVAATPADLAAALRASTADFGALSALIAAIALFVAAFLIFNTLSMTVVERVRDVGLLRAAGATRRDVTAIFLLQAALIGVVGSFAGLVVGVGLAWLIAVGLGSVGDVPLGALELPARGVVLALAVGVAVTLAAALEPARRGALIPPVEALRARVDPSLLRPRLRWIAVVFLVVAVAGALAWPGGTGTLGLVRPLLVYAVLIVGTVLLPALLGPLGALAGAPFRLVLPLEERLGRQALLRDRERATLTLGALTVGVATIVALVTTGANVKAAAESRVAEVVPGDVVVTSIRPISPDEGIDRDIAGISGVASATPIGLFETALDGRRADTVAVSGAALAADGRLRFVAGDRDAALSALDAGGAVILPRSIAASLGVGVGDLVPMLGADPAPRTLRVAGIVASSFPGRTAESVIVGWRDAMTLGIQGADLVAVRFEPGRRDAAEPFVRELARSFALEVRGLGELQGSVAVTLGRVFDLFDALALIAVVVAGLGIVNTLTMSVVERVREIGVLRALGMTRRQVARLVVVEAGVTGVVGSVAGLVLGLIAGAAMTGASVGLDAGFVVPVGGVLAAAAFGVVVATLAAWQPARLAADVSIVRALRFD